MKNSRFLASRYPSSHISLRCFLPFLLLNMHYGLDFFLVFKVCTDYILLIVIAVSALLLLYAAIRFYKSSAYMFDLYLHFSYGNILFILYHIYEVMASILPFIYLHFLHLSRI